jgi:quercetin dioxygenase-like cupin family protein
VPLHTHPVDEVIVVAEGTAEVALGDEVRIVSAPPVE